MSTDLAITSALATPLHWVTGGGTDLIATVGVTSYNITLPTTWARVLLGTGSTTNTGNVEPLPCFLKCVAAALNGAGTGLTWAVKLDPATGRVKVTANGAANIQLGTPLSKLLGGLDAPTAVPATAAKPPMHLVLLGSIYGQSDWDATTPGAFARGADGRVYGVSSGVTTDARAFTADFLPRDPLVAASLPTVLTPCHQDPSDATALRSLGSNAVWSLDDALAAARAGVCGFAEDSFQSIASEATSGPFHLVTLAPPMLSGVRAPRRNPSIPRWLSVELTLTRIASPPVATRS